MAIEAPLIRAIDGVFERFFAPPAIEAFVRSGSYLVRLCFANKPLADEFLPSFLHDVARDWTENAVTFRTHFLTLFLDKYDGVVIKRYVRTI